MEAEELEASLVTSTMEINPTCRRTDKRHWIRSLFKTLIRKSMIK